MTGFNDPVPYTEISTLKKPGKLYDKILIEITNRGHDNVKN